MTGIVPEDDTSISDINTSESANVVVPLAKRFHAAA
jgi:hypothetical protein